MAHIIATREYVVGSDSSSLANFITSLDAITSTFLRGQTGRVVSVRTPFSEVDWTLAMHEALVKVRATEQVHRFLADDFAVNAGA